MTMSTDDLYSEVLKKVEEYGQEHLLRFYDELGPDGRERLLWSIKDADFSVLSRLDEGDSGASRGKITPLTDVARISDIKRDRDVFYSEGARAVKSGEVAAVLLAGGAGTRLGFDHAKGMYNIGITKDVYIFERIIANLGDVTDELGCVVPLFIMTSEKNNAETFAFFEEMNYFGYDRDHVKFFIQDMAPACDYDGKIFLEEKDCVATSPNGNGGWFSSFVNSGLLDVAKAEGVKWLNVFAVDNVCQRIADPLFVGATILSGAQAGAKVIAKAAPDEKVGVLCLEDGRPSIVEYYELTDELMNAKDENGNPAYNFGVILNYLFDIDALLNVNSGKMPVHVVEKKIPHIDSVGNHIKPSEVCGYKFETLILDMVHLLDGCLAYEVVREREFAPIKNRTGIDSVESARNLLELNGVKL